LSPKATGVGAELVADVHQSEAKQVEPPPQGGVLGIAVAGGQADPPDAVLGTGFGDDLIAGAVSGLRRVPD